MKVKCSTFENFHPVSKKKTKKKTTQDLDVAADSIKLLLAQTEASSSYPVLFFFNISLSVLRRLTRKAVHKQNGFQLSFCCFGLDLNRMCFVFARVYACVCACACVCVRAAVCSWCECNNMDFFFFYIFLLRHQLSSEYLEYAKLPERVRGAEQNVS